MPGKMPLFHQAAEMVLQGVAAGAGDADHAGHGGPPVLADVVDDLEGSAQAEWQSQGVRALLWPPAGAPAAARPAE